jgi:peptidylprolyl isomerase
MISWSNIVKRLGKTSIFAILLVTLSLVLSAGLPAGNAITDGQAILRYALPIDNKPVRDIQASLEDISTQLRGKRWSQVSSDISRASFVLESRRADILKSIPEERQTQAQSILDELKTNVSSIRETVETQNKAQVAAKRDQMLNLVGDLEQLMVKDFPFSVPEEYNNLPQLKGRATIAITTNKGDMTVVVDGYSAPITAGNFVDLVQRGFYDDLEFTRGEESYYLQTGDPKGKEEGFIDPKTQKYRSIPLEVLVKGDPEPLYGVTLEELGRYFDEPALPFSSFGALALARPEDNLNGGSSQFFFFLFEPELTPAGRNLLDGRYAVFGYVTEGKDILDELKAGDKIISAKVVKGGENLVQPTA